MDEEIKQSFDEINWLFDCIIGMVYFICFIV